MGLENVLLPIISGLAGGVATGIQKKAEDRKEKEKITDQIILKNYLEHPELASDPGMRKKVEQITGEKGMGATFATIGETIRKAQELQMQKMREMLTDQGPEEAPGGFTPQPQTQAIPNPQFPANQGVSPIAQAAPAVAGPSANQRIVDALVARGIPAQEMQRPGPGQPWQPIAQAAPTLTPTPASAPPPSRGGNRLLPGATISGKYGEGTWSMTGQKPASLGNEVNGILRSVGINPDRASQQQIGWARDQVLALQESGAYRKESGRLRATYEPSALRGSAQKKSMETAAAENAKYGVRGSPYAQQVEQATSYNRSLGQGAGATAALGAQMPWGGTAAEAKVQQGAREARAATTAKEQAQTEHRLTPPYLESQQARQERTSAGGVLGTARGGTTPLGQPIGGAPGLAPGQAGLTPNQIEVQQQTDITKARNLAQPPTPEETKFILGKEGVERNFRGLFDSFNSLNIGPLRSATAGARGALGMVTPEESQMDSQLAAAGNAITNALSGANVPPPEYDRIRKMLPEKSTGSPAVFAQKLEDAYNESLIAVERAKFLLTHSKAEMNDFVPPKSVRLWVDKGRIKQVPVLFEIDTARIPGGKIAKDLHNLPLDMKQVLYDEAQKAKAQGLAPPNVDMFDLILERGLPSPQEMRERQFERIR